MNIIIWNGYAGSGLCPRFSRGHQADMLHSLKKKLLPFAHYFLIKFHQVQFSRLVAKQRQTERHVNYHLWKSVMYVVVILTIRWRHYSFFKTLLTLVINPV